MGPEAGQADVGEVPVLPGHQDVAGAEIPEVTDDDGTRVRVVCGDFWGKRGPVEGTVRHHDQACGMSAD